MALDLKTSSEGVATKGEKTRPEHGSVTVKKFMTIGCIAVDISVPDINGKRQTYYTQERVGKFPLGPIALAWVPAGRGKGTL